MEREIRDRAFAYIDTHHDEMLKLWKELVSIHSGSANVAGVNRMADKMQELIEGVGGEVKRYSFEKAGDTLTAKISRGAGKPLLISGHMDTVFNAPDELERRPFTITDGKAYGPGVLDMKGGLVIGYFAIKALLEAGYAERDIKIVLTGDEEPAHPNSNAKDLLMENARGCVAAFNMETSYEDNSFVTQRKGSGEFTLAVHGVASHAGNDPERGRSAILEMSHHVIDLQKLTDYSRGITVNVGVIKGGIVYNSIPDFCEVETDFRYMEPAQFAEIKSMVEQEIAKTYVEGTTTEIAVFRAGMDAMPKHPKTDKLFDLLTEASAELGIPAPKQKLVGGGSDAAYDVKAGVPTICAAGVKGRFNHSPQEYAVVSSLFERTKLIIATILKLGRMEA